MSGTSRRIPENDEDVGKYGRQPFAILIRTQGRSVRHVGLDLGFPKFYADRVAAGRARPTEDFQRAMCDLLDLPVEDLFTEAALSGAYRVTSRAKGFRVDEGASDA